MEEEHIRPTRSGLFMIELLIAVGVFTLCAAVCVGLFVRSEVMSRESADLTRAVTEARSVVECWKATGGDPEKTAELCGGTVGTGGRILLRYDSDWNKMESGALGETFQLYLTPNSATNAEFDAGLSDEPGMAVAAVSVVRNGTTRLLLWDLAALEAAS